MATYPVAVKSFTNPTSANTLATYPHHTMHTDEMNEITAVETYLGTNASQSAPVANTVLSSVSNGVSVWAQVNLTTMVTGTLPIGKGGSGLSTVAAFSMLYASATDTLTTLAPNTTTTNKFLAMTGTGSAGQAPSWVTLLAADIPNLAASKINSGQLATTQGGLGADVSGIGKGGLLVGTASNTIGIKVVGSDGQVLTADSASTGGMKWAAASGGSTPTVKLSTIFETAARFTRAVSNGGTNTFGTEGLDQDTTGSASSAANCQWSLNTGSIFDPTQGGIIFSTWFRIVAKGATGQIYFGYGNVTVDGSGHTFTNRHVGFKIVYSGGTGTLSATTGDGTTETATVMGSSNFNASNAIQLIAVWSSGTISFYFRANGGAISAATVITTNIPSSAISNNMQFSVSNAGTAVDLEVQWLGASVEI